ncbi:maleylpyruvate isomerase family mycothiol-dependent enzyme [Nocardia sp. NPDC049707]|uniref:maleylpyruvate isomerase family mycothiol-dependent enzyme n=1 Tax=Nocardia sp. NPDC049707 TaxID=3154735 RepID=UPI003416CA48
MLPLDVRPLFPRERHALLELLGSLDSAQWATPTVCPGWAVRDVTAHILNDYMRRLSGNRDGHPGTGFAAGESLPTYLTRINDEFVQAMRQCSPQTMTDLLTLLGPQLDAVWATTNPTGPAYLDVSWAGDTTTPAWLDIAREYTEFWVHQQQIRDALAHPGADSPALMQPVLVTFLHALPVALRNQVRPPGTAMTFEITGPAGGQWSIISDGTGWDLTTAPAGNTVASVRMDQDTLWRLASRGITTEQARQRAHLHGDHALNHAATNLLAIVA